MPLEVHITRILCWARVRDAVVIYFMLDVFGRQIHPREMGWGGTLLKIGCARVRVVGVLHDGACAMPRHVMTVHVPCFALPCPALPDGDGYRWISTDGW